MFRFCQIFALTLTFAACFSSTLLLPANGYDIFSDAYKRLEDELTEAKSSLKARQDELGAAIELKQQYLTALSVKTNVANQLDTAMSEARNLSTSTRNALTSAQEKANDAKQKLELAKEQSRLAELRATDLKNNLMKTKVVAYDFSTPIRLDFNFKQGRTYLALELIEGISYDSGKVEAIVNGTAELPSFDPLKLTAISLGARISRNDPYTAFRDLAESSAGEGCVYVVSKRMVEFLGAEKAGEAIAKTIVGKGDDVEKEFLRLLDLEYADLVSWLQEHGEKDAERIAIQSLASIVLNKSFVDDTSKMKFHLQVIEVTYTSEIRGTSGLPKGITEKLGIKRDWGISTVKVPHLALAIKLNSKEKHDPATTLTHLKSLHPNDPTAKVDFVKAFSKYAPNEFRHFLEGMPSFKSFSSSQSPAFFQKVTSSLNLTDPSILAAASSGAKRITLTNSPVAKNLEAALSKLAIGNNGSARVDRIEIDFDSCRVHVEAIVRHRHEWGSLQDAINAVSKSFPDVQIDIYNLVDGFDSIIGKAAAARDEAQAALNSATMNVNEFTNAVNERARQLALNEESALQIKAKFDYAQADLLNAKNYVADAASKCESAQALVNQAQNAVDAIVKRIEDATRGPFPRRLPNPFPQQIPLPGGTPSPFPQPQLPGGIPNPIPFQF